MKHHKAEVCLDSLSLGPVLQNSSLKIIHSIVNGTKLVSGISLESEFFFSLLIFLCVRYITNVEEYVNHLYGINNIIKPTTG